MSSDKKYSLHDDSIFELIEEIHSTAVLAADSKTHLRTWKSSDNEEKTFRGLIGTVLYIRKPKEFAKWYDSILEDLLQEFEIDRKRYIYKSSHIAKEFPGRPNNLIYFLNDFVRELFQLDVDVLSSISVYPLTLDIRALEDSLSPGAKDDSPIHDRKIISAYGEERNRLISMSEFFKITTNYYPIVCVWKLSQVLNISLEEVLLDGCQGPVSKAWRELINNCNNISILYHGDEYSPFISSCDLLVRWIDETLKKSNQPLRQDSIEAILHDWDNVTKDIDTEHLYCHSIWNPDLSAIVPLSQRRIQRFEGIYARKPITFLVHEPRSKRFSDRAFFEESPAHTALVKDLYKSGGSYLWFDENTHKEIIHPGSRFLIWGEEGEQLASGLKNLGFEIEVMTPEELLARDEDD